MLPKQKKVKETYAKRGWKLVSQANKKDTVIMTFDISNQIDLNDDEAKGLKLASWIISIVELACCCIMFLSMISTMIKYSPLIDNPQWISDGIDWARTYVFVATIFMILSILGIVVNSISIKFTKKTKKIKFYLVIGILSIISIVGLLTGILLLITRRKCINHAKNRVVSQK